MGRIITLDQLDAENELAPTQENFPALKHFWKFDEVYTISTNTHDYTDSVGGCVMRPANSHTCDGQKLTACVQSGSVALRSGSFASPVGKEPLLMFLATNPSGNLVCHLGGVTAGNTRIRCATLTSVVHDGTTPCVNPTAPTNRTDAMYAHYFNKDSAVAGTNTVEVDAAGTTVSSGGDGTALTLTPMGNETWIDTLGNLYGVALFMFDKVPTDVALAAQWMRLRWLAGEKVIWPGWRNKV